MIPGWFWPSTYLFTAVLEAYMFYDLVIHRVRRSQLSRRSVFLVICGLVFAIWLINMLHLPFANMLGLPLVYFFGGVAITGIPLRNRGNWKGSDLQALVIAVVIFYGIIALVEFLFEALYQVSDIMRSLEYDTAQMLPYVTIIVFEKVVTLAIVKFLNRFRSVEFMPMPAAQFACFMTLPVSTFLILGHLINATHQKSLSGFESLWVIAGCLGLLLSNILIFYLFDRAVESMEKNRALSIEKLKYEYEAKELQRTEERTRMQRGFIHDLEDYLKTIHYLAASSEENENLTHIESIVESMGSRILGAKQKVYCSNSILNAVLAAKEEDAQRNSVRFETDISRIADLSYIEDGDICVLLSNLLNNAIEAACRCDSGYVRFDVYPVGNNNAVAFEVQNSYLGELCVDSSGKLITRKQDRSQHGFGLSNVQDIVRKYEGDYFYEANSAQGVFSTSLILNSPTALKLMKG